MDDNGSSPSVRKKLMRHPADRILAGVCGGIADFTGITLWKIRVAALILALVPSGGVGLVLYLLLWLFLPVGTQMAGEMKPPVIRSSRYRASHLAPDSEPPQTPDS